MGIKMINLLILGMFTSVVTSENLDLIIRSWDELENNVEMRYFERDNYEGLSPDQIWSRGKKIGCEVRNDGNTVSLDFPSGVSSRSQMKINVFTHGFTETVRDEYAKLVPAYFNPAQGWNNGRKDIGVILVDWSPLASAINYQSFNNNGYDLAAKSAIDVGNYVGHCLAEMKKQTRIILQNTLEIQFRLTGFSLGAHLVGKAGRVYNTRFGEKVHSIHGLDPAGPRFVDGTTDSSLPVLNQNKLSKTSALFVYIIHTNGGLKPYGAWFGARLGILDAIGDYDFYPNGGSQQPGCGHFDISCSHLRAVLYYYHSLYEINLLPGYPCSSVTACNEHEITPGREWLKSYWTGVAPSVDNLFYVPVEDNYWSFDKHKDCPTWMGAAYNC